MNNMIERQDGRTFEDFKHVNEHEAEYWDAREIQSLFGYGKWRRFEDAVKRAITSCQQSGNDPGYHFARANRSPEARGRSKK